jgi:hypothetical protein
MLLLVPEIEAELAKHPGVDAEQVCSLAKLLNAEWVNTSFAKRDGAAGDSMSRSGKPKEGDGRRSRAEHV